MSLETISSVSGIVSKLEEFVGDYAAIPQDQYRLPIALWSLATHCYHKFDVFGYLCFTSNSPGAGKTRMLEILECICCRAQIKAKITLAGMCACIERDKPTLLIDQAERLSKNDHNELMGCILSGYRAGLKVTIQRNGEALDRPIYCPKAFALIGDMLAAAKDRSIVFEMVPARTRKRWYRSEARERGHTLQKRCVEAIAANEDLIEDALANMSGLSFLLEREEEIWEPLFVMCDVFCPDRRLELEQSAADICAARRSEPKRIPTAEAKQLSNALRDGERLLHDMLSIIDSAGMRTSEALRKLRAIHNAPWRNYAGEGLTDIKLADLLRRFEVGPRQMKIGRINVRGYKRSDLVAAVSKLLPQQPATPLLDVDEGSKVAG